MARGEVGPAPAEGETSTGTLFGKHPPVTVTWTLFFKSRPPVKSPVNLWGEKKKKSLFLTSNKNPLQHQSPSGSSPCLPRSTGLTHGLRSTVVFDKLKFVKAFLSAVGEVDLQQVFQSRAKAGPVLHRDGDAPGPERGLGGRALP